MWTGTPEEFVGKLEEIAEAVAVLVPIESLAESAEAFAHSVEAITPSKLSGVHGDNKLKVKWYPVAATEVVLKGSGPFQLWEYPGQRAYRIPKYEFSESYAVTTYGVFDHVIHPPRKGHHTFFDTFDRFSPVVEQVIAKHESNKIESIL